MNKTEEWLYKKAREVNSEIELQDLYTSKFMFSGAWVMELIEEYHKEQLTLTDVSNWVAVKDSMPENCDQVFVKYENGKYGINEWWESDNCWKYAFDNMIVKDWRKPPCY
tara:strand:- start:479 stop:808 length:330 start_codon:yes stop_codon:yes gene_type:complete